MEKADKGARATESYWALLFAEGSLGRWIGPMIGGALASYAAAVSAWLNAFGPIGWVMAGLFGFALTAVAFAAIGHIRFTMPVIPAKAGIQFTSKMLKIQGKTGP
jgi:hypothetical protein